MCAAVRFQQPHPETWTYLPAALYAVYCALTGREHEPLEPPPDPAGVLNDLLMLARHEDEEEERRGWRRG